MEEQQAEVLQEYAISAGQNDFAGFENLLKTKSDSIEYLLDLQSIIQERMRENGSPMDKCIAMGSLVATVQTTLEKVLDESDYLGYFIRPYEELGKAYSLVRASYAGRGFCYKKERKEYDRDFAEMSGGGKTDFKDQYGFLVSYVSFSDGKKLHANLKLMDSIISDLIRDLRKSPIDADCSWVINHGERIMNCIRGG